ncbi:MAG: histidine kinase [Desulfobacteraceae bacterium]|nr:histidine kinase [Desulfobacteraceae bacterium]
MDEGEKMADSKEEKIKGLEAELKKARKTLADFSLNLKQAHAAIIQQEKLAAIGQLAAGIAHELNNPLGFVSSNFMTLGKYVEKLTACFNLVVEYSKQDEEMEENSKAGHLFRYVEENDLAFIIEDMGDIVSESRQGLERMASIVDNMRRFSHIDFAGKIAPYDLNEGIANTLVMARNETKYVTEVETAFAPVPQIQCRGDEINQVLLNILVNAAQAIAGRKKKGKGLITIKTHADDENVYCEITDDGPGIPKAVQDRIFDPFFTTKEPGKGTGLGLNISRDIIVNKHKGELSVSSKKGKGTTFLIKLPLLFQEEADQE